MTDIKTEKKNTRKQLAGIRNQYAPADKLQHDHSICTQLAELVQANNHRVIHAYIPMGSEIDITPFLEAMLESGRTVVCPKTLPARTLENRVLHSTAQLETGIMGTRHPAGSEIYEGTYDLIVVPGLAFDDRNYRLGYGGGYYDTFLRQHPDAHKVGIFYPFQRLEQVPTEAHDVALDRVLA